MAAPIDWRKILTGHPILEPLGKYKQRLNAIDDCKSWLAAKDGEIFIWNPNDASILTTNLKHNTLKNTGADRIDPESESSHTFQTLTLTRLPISEVDSIVFSPSGSYLALVSRTELIVVQLPQRWGKHGLYKNGEEKVLCKSIVIGERLLLSVGLKLIHAAWHPGSVDDSHITLLTSDNYIRTYDIHNAASPIESVCICSDGSGTMNSSSIAVQRALGDTVVSFDFGPVTEIQNKASEHSSKPASPRKVWPVFVVCGNGDIYQVLSSPESSKRSQKPVVQGPLPMYPPAEDNYGTDACAILCLPGSPAMLVLVTVDGKLYHCVVMASGKPDDKEKSTFETSLGSSSLALVPPPPCALYVYEEVQLELALTSLAQDDSLTDGCACLMRLQKDILRSDRYFCAHNAGLHCVTLPWLTKIQEYAGFADDDGDLPKLNPDSNASVDHLFCTRLTPSSPASPPLGTCLVSDKLLGNALISLTISLELISLPLRATDYGPPPALLSEQPPKEIASPMKQLHKESFETHIREILRRDASQPIIKMPGGTDLSSEGCLQILSDAVRIMREQYIHKLNHAREDIEKRVWLLREQRRQQEDELHMCKDTKAMLVEKAGDLAEKYEAANDQQEDLVHRLEVILRKLQARLPVMTDAEKSMHKELKNMEEKLKIFKSNIKQLKMKETYQSKQIEQANQRRKSTSSRGHFSKSQQQHLRTLLQHEGDSIADLVQQMSKLKTDVNA